jgi:hypothetical protein
MSWRRIYFCFQKMPIHVWKKPKCISFILRTKALPICPYLCTDFIVLLISYSSGAPEYAPGFCLGSCWSIFIFVCSVLSVLRFSEGPSWSWSYGRWIINYLCNQCLSPLWRCEFESRSWRGVLDTTLCNKVCQWLAASRWFPPSIKLSATF